MAKINWEARFYNDLLSISRKANQLNQYYVQTGDPGYIGEDLGRYGGYSLPVLLRCYCYCGACCRAAGWGLGSA